MSDFLTIALAFPVVIFTLVLTLTVCYWLLVCCGVMNTEASPVDIYAFSAYEKVLAERDDLPQWSPGYCDGPLSVRVTLVSLFGWLVSYFTHLLLIQHLSLGFFYYPLGFASGLFALLIALLVTACVLRAFKPLVRKVTGPPPLPICGRVAIVRSATVTSHRGTALLDDGGAGLLLQVRSPGPAEFKRNDRVVLLHYVADDHVYYVISESDFSG